MRSNACRSMESCTYSTQQQLAGAHGQRLHGSVSGEGTPGRVELVKQSWKTEFATVGEYESRVLPTHQACRWHMAHQGLTHASICCLAHLMTLRQNHATSMCAHTSRLVSWYLPSFSGWNRGTTSSGTGSSVCLPLLETAHPCDGANRQHNNVQHTAGQTLLLMNEERMAAVHMLSS